MLVIIYDIENRIQQEKTKEV